MILRAYPFFWKKKWSNEIPLVLIYDPKNMKSYSKLSMYGSRPSFSSLHKQYWKTEKGLNDQFDKKCFYFALKKATLILLWDMRGTACLLLNYSLRLERTHPPIQVFRYFFKKGSRKVKALFLAKTSIDSRIELLQP